MKMCFWFLHLWENIIYETYRFVRLGMRWVGYIQGVYELIENLILDMKTQKLMSITRILPQLLLLVYYIYIYMRCFFYSVYMLEQQKSFSIFVEEGRWK